MFESFRVRVRYTHQKHNKIEIVSIRRHGLRRGRMSTNAAGFAFAFSDLFRSDPRGSRRVWVVFDGKHDRYNRSFASLPISITAANSKIRTHKRKQSLFIVFATTRGWTVRNRIRTSIEVWNFISLYRVPTDL